MVVRSKTLLLAACAAALLGLPPSAGAAPSRPSGLAVTDVAGGHARLVWSPGPAGGGQTARYRVYRDGHPYKRVRGRALRVRIGRARVYRVAATDARGNVGPRSNPVKVIRGHRPPGAPARVRASKVGQSRVRLSWRPSRARGGRLAGYRIFRNGLLVRQVRGRRGSDRKLAAGTSYRFTVAAVDTQGYQSRSARLAVSTDMPGATQGRAHAFLLATTDESFRDLQRHYRQVGTVYPTYFECRAADGEVSGRDDPLITSWSRLRGIQVLPRFDCQRPGTLHSILADPRLREATISALVALASKHGYDGINVDFENGDPSDRAALIEFVSRLATRLHAAGRRLAVEVSAKYQDTTTGRSGFYDYEALGAVADTVFVMNWGWHWATSGPGAPDDMELCRKVADYAAAMPTRTRFVLGTHLYGMDWPNGGGPANRATALEYADVRALIERHMPAPTRDPLSDAWTFGYVDAAGARHEVWYPDATTIARRVRLARDRGLGVGFWRLGREDQRMWADPQIAPGT